MLQGINADQLRTILVMFFTYKLAGFCTKIFQNFLPNFRPSKNHCAFQRGDLNRNKVGNCRTTPLVAPSTKSWCLFLNPQLSSTFLFHSSATQYQFLQVFSPLQRGALDRNKEGNCSTSPLVKVS